MTLASAQERLLQAHGVPFRSRRLATTGPVRNTHVIDAGLGRDLLLVHGGGGFAAQWAPLMGRLHRGHRLLAVDRPGFGLTDPFSYVAPLDLRAHAVSFLEGVLDALGLERVPIVANSMGALWSMWLALDRPERVERLILMGCPALLLDSSAPWRMRLQSHARLHRLAGRDDVRRVYREMGDPAAAADLAYTEAVRASWARPGADEAFWPLVRQVVGLRGQKGIRFGEDELRRLAQPVRMVWGARDPFAPVSVARRAAEHLPEAQLFVISGGHLPWLTSLRDAACLVWEALPAPAAVRAAPVRL